MAKKDKTRISLTIDKSLLAEYDLIASTLGYSRSAIILAVLEQSRTPLVQVCNTVNSVISAYETGDKSVIRRARGESLDELTSKLDELLSEIDVYQKELFDD